MRPQQSIGYLAKLALPIVVALVSDLDGQPPGVNDVLLLEELVTETAVAGTPGLDHEGAQIRVEDMLLLPVDSPVEVILLEDMAVTRKRYDYLWPTQPKVGACTHTCARPHETRRHPFSLFFNPHSP